MTKKIRVIYVLPCFGIGGTERVVLNLCQNVSRDLFDIEVCTMVGGLFADQVAESGIPVHLLAPPESRQRSLPAKVLNYRSMLSSLKKTISSPQPTVVHTHHYTPLLQLFLIRKATSKPFGWLHTEHSWTDVRNAYEIPLYKYLNPMKAPDMINGVADKVTSCMQKVSGIPADRAVTVLNGIDVARYCGENREKKRRELGFGPEEFVVGTVGMLRPEKNQQLLVRAFALLVKELPNIRLVICGEGECRADLEKLATELGVASQVDFLGYRIDSHEIMSALDLYCLPSVYEGLPLSILEAWAARRPVVATEVMGNVDIVRHNQNGMLVPLGDERAMADALLKLAVDRPLADKFAVSGNDVVTAQFDIRQMVAHYEHIYQELAC